MSSLQSEMDDLATAHTTESETVQNELEKTPGGVAKELRLIQAQPEHFAVDRTIYVRSKPACIVELDYPNVFWRFDGSDSTMIKHRSFLANPEIFQVPEGSETTQGMHPRSKFRAPSDLLDLCSVDLADNGCDEDGNEDDDDDNNDSQPNVVSSSGLMSGLMAMLQRRPSKTEYNNERGSDVTVSAKFPAGIHINKCEDSQFSVPNKVAHIAAHHCDDVSLEFSSVISSVELMKCNEMTVVCSKSFGTMTIESSSNSTIRFPATCTSILVVTTLVINIRLEAMNDSGEVVADHVLNIEDVPDEGDIPVVRAQQRTKWDGTAFDTELIQRDGAQGNIRNL